ncbi:hypothetical protein DVK85_11180 [Flavobacterium arcticum]|uniref:Uncharacterized protein n=1 Tax=Flavobacterium arcticum TaxID=1784713 RepID=A0A345HDV2_9FLAO|nr:hypothetical protein [Flavobacterium arcticum]AXG74762.1 hypothetical protein DVK85_11180 [Flavobacterium arcticum]KAF2509738.1 hypothetical protein E0W72_09495 [Flavobacterium arcticum]
MRETIHKIKVPENETFESIIQQKDSGGKFVFYEYLIPRPLIAPGRGASKIFFIKKGEKTKHHIKYNIITLLWGWWGLPFGLLYIPKTIRNNKTGIDVTEDVYNNITKEDFNQGQVIIKNIATAFIPIDKSSLKELTKCFKKYEKYKKAFTTAPITAIYIDTYDPIITIGLFEDDMIKVDELKKEIYKYFFANIQFKFINLDDDTELSAKLKKQGESIQL